MINIKEPVHFYDDRSKYDFVLQLSEILYHDGNVCLCIANPVDDYDPEYVLFDLESGKVLTADREFFLATNDNEYIYQRISDIQERGL